MEHSWITNDFVGLVERLIAKGGDWYKTRIVWAGDYAEGEKNDKKPNLYHAIKNKINPTFEPLKGRKLRFLKNLDTKEFVDLNNVPGNDGWFIHPLPLLTCEGNGQGGGDFFGKDPNGLVGKWARNRVVMQRNRPRTGKEIVFDLME
jgi:hypothetical protein